MPPGKEVIAEHSLKTHDTYDLRGPQQTLEIGRSLQQTSWPDGLRLTPAPPTAGPVVSDVAPTRVSHTIVRRIWAFITKSKRAHLCGSECEPFPGSKEGRRRGFKGFGCGPAA